MNKRQAKKEACKVVATLIESYLGVGQPCNDCDAHVKGWKPEDSELLARAFQTLQFEMERRGD